MSQIVVAERSRSVRAVAYAMPAVEDKGQPEALREESFERPLRSRDVISLSEISRDLRFLNAEIKEASVKLLSEKSSSDSHSAFVKTKTESSFEETLSFPRDG